MGILTFIGLGLNDERGISIRGLEEARNADFVFAEFYTSLMPNLSMPNLEKLIGKPVTVLSRHDVEENARQIILDKVKDGRTVFLVPGDPMIATTHIDLRLRAERLGIDTRIIGAASIQTAAAAITGLQSYKFGRTITLPLTATTSPESPYHHLKTNRKAGLHTLILLDLHAEKRQYMTIPEGIRYLLEVENRRKEKVFEDTTLAIGVARAGADDVAVKAAAAASLEKLDFGPAPHSLIVPGELHFMEMEALKVFARAEDVAG